MGACVVQAGEMSKSFGVNTGVKQGCVLAPVIFNLFPVAVTLVFRHNISQMAFASSTGSMAACLISTVCKQRRNNKGHHIRSTIRRRRCPAQPHTRRPAAAAGCISSAYSRAGLVVNSQKTEVFYLPSDSSLLPTFYISGDQLGLTEQFTYLGSIITSTWDLTAEIQHRVNLASTSFGRLSKRVFTNRDLSTRIKMALYNAICVSTVLYACEGWTPYRGQIRVLEAFYIRCLQTILHVHWLDKIPHVELRRRAGTTCLETILLRRQLRWLGHVIRMPGNRLTRRLLYS